MMIATIASVTILCYILGSVPFGLVVTRLAGLGDIRKIGSGNIGATNVLRTGRKKLALMTLLLDGGKGAVAVLLARAFYRVYLHEEYFDQRVLDFTYLAGFAVFVGHLYPVWLKFKGGKGVATAVGVITALAWPFGVGVMLLWILVAYITRYSSLAALISLGAAPLAALYFDLPHAACLGFLIFGFIAFKHKENIRRLRKGTEPKISIGGKKWNAAS